MKKLSVHAFVLTAPSAVRADHLDVIDVTLEADCSLPEYLAIIEDFNERGDRGTRLEP